MHAGGISEEGRKRETTGRVKVDSSTYSSCSELFNMMVRAVIELQTGSTLKCLTVNLDGGETVPFKKGSPPHLLACLMDML